jgi:exo-beta-1,3-glucanase (GH17 family)
VGRSRIQKLALISLAIIPTLWVYSRQSELRRNKDLRVSEWAEQNWICYAPTGYDPRRSALPTIESIESDLALIKAAGFEGIITYEVNSLFARIPQIARASGLAVIQGIWAPADRRELRAAIALAEEVDGYCVGNEGLGTRYSLSELDEGLAYVANQVDVPVAISEQIHVYFENPMLVEMGDWLFPIVHPHFGNAKTLAAATQWIFTNTDRLERLAGERGVQKRMFIKEIGMPSGGDPEYSEIHQARFLDHLLSESSLKFALFEAFDRKGWEYISDVEPYWGLFHSDRTAKPAVPAIVKALEARRANGR